MIPLDREVNDAKPLAVMPGGTQESESHARKQKLAPQGRDTRPERDMHRLPLAMNRARPVRGAAPGTGFASGARACATPAIREFEGELSRGSHN